MDFLFALSEEVVSPFSVYLALNSIDVVFISINSHEPPLSTTLIKSNIGNFSSANVVRDGTNEIFTSHVYKAYAAVSLHFFFRVGTL